jgi:hypothetical protein
MGPRTRLKFYVDGWPDPLIIDAPSRGEIGKPYVELGSKRVTDHEPLSSLLSALMTTAEEWLEKNRPRTEVTP